MPLTSKAIKVALLAATCLFAPSAQAEPAEVLKNFIKSAAPTVAMCSRERQAIEHTVSSLDGISFPSEGKFVLVNIPTGILTAYEDGSPVLEMDIKVGTAEHQTPVWTTRLTEVRLNPTWTVPWTIVRDDEWRKRLVEEPEFFTRNRFELRTRDNELLSIEEASKNPNKVARFVQSPGRYNALGEYRFNIESSSAIYLHDTRDRQNFHDGSPLTLSHGCVRLEKPLEFAKWLLNKTEDEITDLKRDGSTLDIPIEDHIPLVMGYFTAWPDSTGDIVVYDDIYEKEDKICGQWEAHKEPEFSLDDLY
ncbi:L,D-transpeptidase family protein [Sulfitobacter sp. R18_1]|uniref:L,D-transpeptidase family protein n=1 Tax=Sulfitobacter sp. R18_1 TaxID=2821104 RepID=UPI001ADB8B6D|nr:L,D-transpeptidase family protein [Sulfitobacter sp. R18_1]MBO9428401.1 L,D-transpeptidase family protein [Sulfitobacter sp. R18_1]